MIHLRSGISRITRFLPQCLMSIIRTYIQRQRYYIKDTHSNKCIKLRYYDYKGTSLEQLFRSFDNIVCLCEFQYLCHQRQCKKTLCLDEVFYADLVIEWNEHPPAFHPPIDKVSMKIHSPSKSWPTRFQLIHWFRFIRRQLNFHFQRPIGINSIKFSTSITVHFGILI